MHGKIFYPGMIITMELCSHGKAHELVVIANTFLHGDDVELSHDVEISEVEQEKNKNKNFLSIESSLSSGTKRESREGIFASWKLRGKAQFDRVRLDEYERKGKI